jgi:Ca2+-binding EF-hand superfamily protein
MKGRFFLSAATALFAAWLGAAADPPQAKRAGAGSGDPAPAREPAPADKDVQDFVFFGDSRPVLVRLHLRIDGKPFQTIWDEFIDHIFKDLDKDGDGFISREEVDRMPAANVLFNTPPGFFAPGLQGGGGGFGGPAQTFAFMDTNKDGKISRDELADFYRRNGGAPFQIKFGADRNVQRRVGQFVPAPPAAGEAVSEALFKLLDTNNDGKLSREELAAAPAVLQRLDIDDDEMITIQEILPNSAPNNLIVAQFARPPAPPTPRNAVFLALGPGESGTDLARRLLERYGPKEGKGDKKLSRREIGLDQATFDLLDADKDGKLDAEELARFAKRPADLELNADVGSKGRKVELTARAAAPAAAKQKDKAVQWEQGLVRLELETGDVPGPGPFPATQGRMQVLNQFKMADADNKGYLEMKDVRQRPLFRDSFKAMDANGDGKLEEKEVLAYLDKLEELQKKARAACVSLTVSDNSRGLFDLIDTNHDGRLSVRELRNAVKLVDQYGKDGAISRNDIPRNYHLTLRPGPAQADALPVNVAFISAGQQAPPPPAPTAGPLWFRKMDRNRDGDVSCREFLGTDEEFRKIDTDGDGLISLEEAERYDAALRKAKEQKP